MRSFPGFSGEVDRISVERALAELRSGRPVLIEDQAVCVLATGVEGLDASRCAGLDGIAKRRARLVLPPARLRCLGLNREQAGAVSLPTIDWGRIESLALKGESRIDAPVSSTTKIDEDALDLTRLALILPAALVIPVSSPSEFEGVVRTSGAAVRAFRTARVCRITIVERVPVPLEDARDAEFVVFRGGEGLRDQVAVVVGTPDFAKPIPVRLHSACLTADLFDSLRCGSGDQLRDGVRRMTEDGGGILLYLDQEGRGNGIADKIHASRAPPQGHGADAADPWRGSDPYGRRFDFAAEMLRQLGVRHVRIIPNHPDAAAALHDAGIGIGSEHALPSRRTAGKARYPASRRDRAGRSIDLDGPAWLAPVRD